jgi:hypothetical protein
MRFRPDVAECSQWEGGQTDFFTLIKKTETVNMRFPRDVTE